MVFFFFLHIFFSPKTYAIEKHSKWNQATPRQKAFFAVAADYGYESLSWALSGSILSFYQGTGRFY